MYVMKARCWRWGSMLVMEAGYRCIRCGGCAEGGGGCAALYFALSSFSFLKAL